MRNAVMVVVGFCLVLSGCMAEDPGVVNDDVQATDDQEPIHAEKPPTHTISDCRGAYGLCHQWAQHLGGLHDCEHNGWSGGLSCDAWAAYQEVDCLTELSNCIILTPFLVDVPAPAPSDDGTDDLRVIRDACKAWCDINGTVCSNECARNNEPDYCYANCDPDICRGQCSTMYPGL